MLYIKEQSDQKTKKNYLGSTGGTLKKYGTKISVILKNTKKTVQKYRNTSENLKVATVIIK